VRVVAFRAHRIQVTGEVAQPGVVTLDDTTKGLLQAITERGGLTPTASRRSAYLTRAGQSYRVDLAGLLSGARPSANPLLQPGDIVHVPDTEDDSVFMLGEVAKQGPVVLGQQRTTLVEALSRSEGLTSTAANDSGVLVFRRATRADQPATIYAVDLSDAEGLLLAGEFNLEPRDVVYVKATAFSQYNLIINQLLPTISTIFQVDALVDRNR
jgi:polysaccharide export outer membrane protein